jgi:hypothetical protein
MNKPKGSAVRSVRDSGRNTPALDRALAVLEFVVGRPHGVTQSSHLGMQTGLECIVLDRVVGPHPYKC